MTLSTKQIYLENHLDKARNIVELNILLLLLKDARFSIRESLSKWLPSYTEALESRPSSSGKKFDPVEVCTLLYTTRIATSKILIELEEWDSATKVTIEKAY